MQVVVLMRVLFWVGILKMVMEFATPSSIMRLIDPDY